MYYNAHEVAPYLRGRYEIPDAAFRFQWSEFTEVVIEAATREFSQPEQLDYYCRTEPTPWDTVLVGTENGLVAVPRYAVVRSMLRDKRMPDGYGYIHDAHRDIYVAYTIALLSHATPRYDLPKARVRFVMHGHMFMTPMPNSGHTIYYEYALLPEPSGVDVHVQDYPPALLFNSDDVAAAHTACDRNSWYSSPREVRTNFGSTAEWPWFLVDFDDALTGARARDTAEYTPASPTDAAAPLEVIEHNGVSAPRWMHVRDALRAADAETVAALGYTAPSMLEYRAAALNHAAGLRVDARRLVPHPAPCSPKAVAFLRDVGGWQGECPRALFGPSGEQDGVDYTKESEPGWSFALVLRTYVGYRIGSVVAPWWMVDFIEETAERRRERVRKRAKANLDVKLQAWARDGRTGNLTIAQIRAAGGKLINSKRNIRVAMGRAFEWARTQRDWPACAVHDLLLEWNGHLRNRDAITARTRKASIKYVAKKFGVIIDPLLAHPSIFRNVYNARECYPELVTIKQDKATPWDGYRGGDMTPWWDEHWSYVAVNPMLLLHAAQPAKDDPMKVAFYKSFNDWLNAKRTVMKPGRYLKKYYGQDSPDACIPWLNEDEVRTWAEQWEEKHRPVEVHFKENTDPDGWEWVYRNEVGFESCMSGCKYEGNGPRAVRAYAHPENNLALAYMLNKTGDGVTARCIVNKHKMVAGRVYGDARLRLALTRIGYQVEVGGLIGEKLALIPVDGRPGQAYMPYLDYGTESGGGATNIIVSEDATHFVVTGNGVGYRAANYESARVHIAEVLNLTPHKVIGAPSEWGVITHDDEYTCDCCHDETHPDDLHRSDYHDIRICDGCLDEYRFVYVGRAAEDWVHEDNVVEYNGRSYLDDDDVLDAHGLRRCDYSGDVIHVDDAVEVPTGEWVHARHTAILDIAHTDEFGNQYTYAYAHDIIETTDGDTIYEGDAFDLEDGRTYHNDDVVQWEDGSMHHKDDERPDDEAQDTDTSLVSEPSQHDTAYIIAA